MLQLCQLPLKDVKHYLNRKETLETNNIKEYLCYSPMKQNEERNVFYRRRGASKQSNKTSLQGSYFLTL
jgi:hypothetical protein